MPRRRARKRKAETQEPGSYAELQKRAKACGIRANQRADVLRQLLSEGDDSAYTAAEPTAAGQAAPRPAALAALPKPAVPAGPPTPPQEFICPITMELMNDPVSDVDGNSYEHAAIVEALKRKQRSPLTRTPMTIADLRPNRALRDSIARWREEHNLGPILVNAVQVVAARPRRAVVRSSAWQQAVQRQHAHERAAEQGDARAVQARQAERARNVVEKRWRAMLNTETKACGVICFVLYCVASFFGAGFYPCNTVCAHILNLAGTRDVDAAMSSWATAVHEITRILPLNIRGAKSQYVFWVAHALLACAFIWAVGRLHSVHSVVAIEHSHATRRRAPRLIVFAWLTLFCVRLLFEVLLPAGQAIDLSIKCSTTTAVISFAAVRCAWIFLNNCRLTVTMSDLGSRRTARRLDVGRTLRTVVMLILSQLCWRLVNTSFLATSTAWAVFHAAINMLFCGWSFIMILYGHTKDREPGHCTDCFNGTDVTFSCCAAAWAYCCTVSPTAALVALLTTFYFVGETVYRAIDSQCDCYSISLGIGVAWARSYMWFTVWILLVQLWRFMMAHKVLFCMVVLSMVAIAFWCACSAPQQAANDYRDNVTRPRQRRAAARRRAGAVNAGTRWSSADDRVVWHALAGFYSDGVRSYQGEHDGLLPLRPAANAVISQLARRFERTPDSIKIRIRYLRNQAAFRAMHFHQRD